MSSWFEVTVEVPNEIGEVVASLLVDLGSPGLECSDRGGITSLVAYFREMPSFDAVYRLCSGAGGTLECSPLIRSRAIEDQDWAENWKRHFQPLTIGRQLLITPPWNASVSTDRIVIVIEPAMAFGTGQHSTTRGCLELIEEAVAAKQIARALDVGTGSGILGIALARLGVRHVQAIDNDITACHAAAANIERNSVAGSMCVTADWRDVDGTFDLIVANLFTNLLRDLSAELRRRLAPNGSLICSGFLSSDEAAVVDAYSTLHTRSRRDHDDWTALMLGPLDSSIAARQVHRR
jgi:ribosomal protein L11 methyltransferase